MLGFTRLDRLITIGLTSLPLQYPALKAAQSEARGLRNIPRYLTLSEHLEKLYPNDASIRQDPSYMQEVTGLTQLESQRLENELKGYKNNLIKESIRMAQEELGIHHFSAGNLTEAAKSFSKMREFCTTQAHLAFMHLRMALVGIAQGNWLSVQNCVTRIQNQPSFPDFSKISPAVKPILGLCAMAAGDYATAAGYFVQTDPAFVAPLEPVAGNIVLNRAVLSANDCAVYGALTALATFDRSSIQSQLLDSSATFRQFLELEPHLRRAMTSFVSSKYTQCLRTLEQYRADWLCDVYLQRHVENIFTFIRRKCIVEYFKPFSAVTIESMAEAFGSGTGPKDVETMTDELVMMISSRELDARIDAVGKRLVKPQRESERESTIKHALRVAEQQEHAMYLRIWRNEMLLHGLEVKPENKKGSRMDVGGLIDGGGEGDVPVLAKRGKKGT